MAYTKTDWLEWIPGLNRPMSAAEKLAGLNNAEKQYDESKAALDAHNHDSRYYTKIQMDAKYWRKVLGGPGSGWDAGTLDGWTAAAILQGGISSGLIGWWKGSIDTIPPGWRLCDGTYSTPDIRNKFVIGAGNGYAVGDYGGTNSITPTATVAVGLRTLTLDMLPPHSHTYADTINQTVWTGTFSAYTGLFKQEEANGIWNTTETETQVPHTHIGIFTGSPNENRPRYIALPFIMRA